MNATEFAADRKPYPWPHRVLGGLFRGLIWLFRVLPGALAYGVADLLVPILVLVTVWNRERATRKKRGFFRNTTVVFRGALSPELRRRLLWRWARHMTNLCVDVCKMPCINAANIETYCDLTDLATIRKYYDRGKGLVCATGHIGVYEHSSHLIVLSGMRVVTIFRESPIPVLTDIINEIRTASGQRMTERKGAVREMLRAARNGECLGLVADISSKESEIFAPFLGTEAATNNTPGILHLKTEAPIMVITTHRTARRRYKIHVWDIIENQRSGDREADLREIARRISAGLTRAITTYPEQWFWDSRRFRARPAGEVRDAEDLPARTDATPAAAILARL